MWFIQVVVFQLIPWSCLLYACQSCLSFLLLLLLFFVFSLSEKLFGSTLFAKKCFLIKNALCGKFSQAYKCSTICDPISFLISNHKTEIEIINVINWGTISKRMIRFYFWFKSKSQRYLFLIRIKTDIFKHALWWNKFCLDMHWMSETQLQSAQLIWSRQTWVVAIWEAFMSRIFWESNMASNG